MTPQLDETAHTLEMKWGVDRLPKLVTRETAERFGYWRDQLNDAIEHGATHARIQELADIVERGWKAMEAEALARGCFPLPPACYSIRCEDSIVEIAETQEHATALLWWAKNEGRTVAVWTLDEVATVLNLHGIAHKAKMAFPGAMVTALPTEFRPGKRKANLGHEEIPFGGEGEAA